jgi:oxygen-independent coproporphyrinogen-3 oxidase
VSPRIAGNQRSAGEPASFRPRDPDASAPEYGIDPRAFEEGFSLYIHIPFCRSLCSYCDFYSRPLRDIGEWGDFARALLDEAAGMAAWLETRAEAAGVRRISWRTAFLGGGTPSLMPARTMVGLVEGLRAVLGKGFSDNDEFTIECNPESLDEEKINAYADIGINRISLGLQSLDERALSAAGRPCDSRRARRALELINGKWKGWASADLMVGLPFQDEEGPSRDLAEAVAAGCGHVSAYRLTIEEGTPFFEARRTGALPFPGEDETAERWEGFQATANALGLLRYEVSNFARPGEECRHNLGYWAMAPYLGLGPAAVSSFPAPGGTSIRRSQPAAVDAYLGASDPCALAEWESVSWADSMKDYLLMALRTRGGARRARFEGIFGLPLQKAIGKAAADFEGRGLVESKRESIAMTPAGIELLDAFLIACFSEIDGLAMPKRSGLASSPDLD